MMINIAVHIYEAATAPRVIHSTIPGFVRDLMTGS
jgi:hypothetical protein